MQLQQVTKRYRAPLRVRNGVCGEAWYRVSTRCGWWVRLVAALVLISRSVALFGHDSMNVLQEKKWNLSLASRPLKGGQGGILVTCFR